MNYSLSYYITLFVIKIKGLKKDFSSDPIDFKKIRKADVHHPKGSFFRGDRVRNFKVAKSLITEVKPKNDSDSLLIFIHGGAFISGPAQHHWDTVKELSKRTTQTIWLCDYPKAPENKITEISENIDSVYDTALKEFKAGQITLIGDSVGGTLVAALTQRLVKKNVELPKKLILVSPVMDASMSNDRIPTIDSIDPMLSKAGVLSAKKMCAEDGDLNNPMISPIKGNFDNFPETILFLAEHDITYPDQQLAVQKMLDVQVDLEVILGKGMPHIWPILPVMKESKTAFAEIIDRLNSEANTLTMNSLDTD